jgi:1-acyl-sn-glycerol-3-phosphate acyltransferase
MITRMLTELMKYLPERAVILISKRIVESIVNKYAKIEVIGKENIKGVKRPIIFICNHLSNSDGLILNRVLKDEDVTFVAGIKLSNDPFTNIGINAVKTIQIRPNTADKEALTKVIKTVREGHSVVIFPEGTRSRTGSMIEAKKGILLIAKLTKAPIIPIGMWGTEKLLPINKEGDMGSEKFRHAEVKINIGKQIEPVDKDENEDRHAHEDRMLWTLMKSIAELMPEEYRGVYR